MKLLFTDLDGTLLNNDSKISPVTFQFLKEFIAAGNKLILSSGRPLHSIMEVLDESGLTSDGVLLICSNGTQIYDCSKQESILEKRLPLEYVSYLQNKAVACGLHIQTYRDDAVISIADDEEIRFYRRRIHLPLVTSTDFTKELVKGPFKMLAIHLTDHDRLLQFREDLSEWADGKIQMIFSNPMYLELFDYTAGKGNAVRFVCDYFGVPLSDAFAAGDADNDISMIEAAGCGIAMLNAAQPVKDSADVITELDNDHDGLAHMMKKLLQ